jgi:hypothetical protein
MKLVKHLIVGGVGAAALIASMGAQGGCGATTKSASAGSNVVTSSGGGAGSSDTTGSSGSGSTSTSGTAKLPAKPKAPAKPRYTVAEQNALESAENYLSEGMGFSKAGLIDQLSSSYGEGFTKADAVFAVNHVKVNWYKQAVLSAKNYLSEGMGFSRASLISQLTSSYGEKFTLSQATYAANQVGLH